MERKLFFKGLFTAYSHQASALIFTLMLALALERFTLVSIAVFTSSVNINTSIKFQMGSGPTEKHQH